MSVPGLIKPADKTIKSYHATLQGYSDEQVTHEGATETAFQRLLADTAKSHGWFLIPKLSIKRGGKQSRAHLLVKPGSFTPVAFIRLRDRCFECVVLG